MKKHFVIAVSGVAGSGKDSVLEKLWQYPQLYQIVVSYTDRTIRPGEIDGKNYHFISPAEFDRGIKAGEFIEWEASHGEHRYGRKKIDFDHAFATGKTVVMVLDVLGAQKFKKIFDLGTIFITPPNLEVAIERLKKRGTETPERIQKRIERYAFELSFRDKYDHILINDDLETAQKEFIEMIKKEKEKRERKENRKKLILPLLLVLMILGLSSPLIYASYKKVFAEVKQIATFFKPTAKSSQVVPQKASVVPTVTASPEVQQKIASTPTKPADGKIVQKTTKNNNGSTTTTVSTGGAISQSDLAKLSSSTGTINTPLDVPFSDETGKYPALGATLENYLNITLRWRSEISSLKNISIENAGDTGWNGQYLGSYTTSGTGKIIAAQGSIIINTYYIESQYCTPANTFTNCESEYAKLFLSHEYGHHYTLSHKWLDWNLPNGTRFPDSYYTTRPLSKNGTATDYSLGWSNCEVEIIAEDYSYLYSGYGQHAMHAAYGYPSAATKTWLDNVGSSSELAQVTVANPTPTPNLAPVVSITSPADSTTLSGTADFTASASDDVSVSSVAFYVGDQLISTDSASPYQASLNTVSFANGPYTLKAIASDGTLTSEKDISVTFSNSQVDTTKPNISISAPTENPYTLVGDHATVTVGATDNVGVSKIELYFNDTFQNSWNTASLSLAISFKTLPPGTYTLKFRAYDKAGNYNDTTLTVIKGS